MSIIPAIERRQLSSSPKPKSPLLLLPAATANPDQQDSRCFFSLEDKKNYCIKNFNKLLGYDSWCIGSSHGWLIVLDSQAKPFLLNPFSQSRIPLPSLLHSSMFSCDTSYFIEQLRKSFIVKAILLSAPLDNSYTVVLVYGVHPTRLAFCKNEDSKWNLIENIGKQDYCDIISINDLVHALRDDNNLVEVWDFSASLPRLKSVINVSLGTTFTNDIKPYKDLHFTKKYLVESSGELLFVVRVIGCMVNAEGEAVDESYLLGDEDTQPLVCPYRTMFFYVWKLDLKEQKWVKVKNLKDETLFIGVNHSVSSKKFSGLEKNCIYFTDDNWDEMNVDYLYGGHDIGKFSFEDETIKPFIKLDEILEESRIDPPPLWIIPNPW